MLNHLKIEWNCKTLNASIIKKFCLDNFECVLMFSCIRFWGSISQVPPFQVDSLSRAEFSSNKAGMFKVSELRQQLGINGDSCVVHNQRFNVGLMEKQLRY